MRRVPCLYLLIAIAIFCTVSQACTQTLGENDGQYSVYAGAFTPTGSALKDNGPAVWVSFGLVRNTNLDESNRPGASISFDYASAENDRFRGSRVGLNYTRYFRGAAADDTARGLYFGFGAGFSYNKDEMAERIEEPPIPYRKDSGVQYAVSGLVGYDFSESVFAELKYTQTTELATDINFSGLTLLIGSRSLF